MLLFHNRRVHQAPVPVQDGLREAGGPGGKIDGAVIVIRYKNARSSGRAVADQRVIAVREAGALLAYVDAHKEEIDAAYSDTDANGGEKPEAEKFRFSVDLPDTLTAIGETCFAYCERLRSANLHEGITDVETMGFFRCEQMETLDLPTTLERIGSDAFSYSGSLTYIFIPKSVVKIGHHAFFGSAAPEIRMEASEEEVRENVDLGNSWTPRIKKVVYVKVPVLYSQVKEAA